MSECVGDAWVMRVVMMGSEAQSRARTRDGTAGDRRRPTMIATRTMTSSLLVRGSFPHLPTRTLAILALVATTVLWVSLLVPAKLLLAYIPPFALAFFRFAIALMLLVPLLRRCAAGAVPRTGGTTLHADPAGGSSPHSPPTAP